MKTNLRQSLTVCRLEFLLWKGDLRLLALGIFILAYMAVMVRPYRRFAADMGIASSPWVLPFLVFPAGLALLTAVGVVLFSPSPYANPQLPLILVRTGRMNWIMGQLLYIIGASLAYTLFVALASVSVLFPYVRWTNQWGTLIDSLFTSLAPYRMGYPISFQCAWYVYFELTPGKAMLLTMLLFTLVNLLLGTVIVFGNLVFRRRLGVLLAGGLIGFSLFAEIAGYISSIGSWISYLSPVTWGSLNGVVLHDPDIFPHIGYALATEATLIVLLWLVTVLHFQKQDIVSWTGGQNLG